MNSTQATPERIYLVILVSLRDGNQIVVAAMRSEASAQARANLLNHTGPNGDMMSPAGLADSVATVRSMVIDDRAYYLTSKSK